MRDASSDRNVLFVQDSSPCIRTIKVATALQSNGFNVHLAHRSRTPDEAYGYGNGSFASLAHLPRYRFRDVQAIRGMVADKGVGLVHFHNQPDGLGAKLIRAHLGVPVIYDQHDFLSFKHRLSPNEREAERICNEEADGVIYITESYRTEVSRHYALVENSLCFANYLSESGVLDKGDELPKLSSSDGRTHLVYIGRISEHARDHRNITQVCRQLAEQGYVLHIYPSKDRDWPRYSQMDHVVVHPKLPYRPLIREISQYDFGLTVFNPRLASVMPHVRYALGNKTFDYLSAGLPVLTQEGLEEVARLLVDNGFGLTLEAADDPKRMSEDRYNALVEHIRQERGRFAMEHQIHRLIEFYGATLARCNSNG